MTTTAPCLARSLHGEAPGVRRFLREAVDLDQPELGSLVEAGVPHYTASELLRRLRAAGELADQGWSNPARDAYRRLLEEARPRLHRLPDRDRPREKAAFTGVGSLADDELLALILRTGSGDEGVLELAGRLLDEGQGLLGLADLAIEELCRLHGIGPAKAAEMAAAFELGRRMAASRRRERPVIRSPEDAVALLGSDLVALRHEEFWCLPLDARSRLIGEPRRISRGDVDGTEAGPRAFFRMALQVGAVSAVAIHNHPTGDTQPSAADRAVTRRLVQAGRTVDLDLVDHLIIGDGGRFTSLRRDEPHLFTGP